ncbi:MAG: 4-alpha-glucanotransferase [Anaerolineales bacterium]|nr:4-alpha-glucanotransferase [Anaerolineales bacterium]
MAFKRSSGILLHPTSLPSAFGIGDLGESAYRFLDFMQASRQQLWQVLPLGPTGYADSPYQCFSAFAGNPMLIDLYRLTEKGFLQTDDLNHDRPTFDNNRVDYGQVINYKTGRLQLAYSNFKNHISADFEAFCAANAPWLDDFALFMAIKIHHGGGSWVNWPSGLVRREPEALAAIAEKLADSVNYQKFMQWCFFEQWEALKKSANDKGILIVGDVPIFVAHDSADAWANPNLFYLDEDGQPTVVAGVPPDYFSATGQRWGNPLYRWDVMKRNNYHWWIQRFRAMLTMVDIVRIDHFRGFEAYWEIPAEEETAVKGEWVKGPGADFFIKIREALGGELPLIAEDLGVITEEVTALRTQFDLPGMRIVQFAFGDDSTNHFLPHNYDSNTVVYTGTHDNETTMGWFRRSDTTGTTDSPEVVARERNYARAYAKILEDNEAHWDLIRLAWMSVADMAITPMQDLLGLGNEARMNFPSSNHGNWQWRLRADQLSDEIIRRLSELTVIYGRD